ncbi:hypothetical protein [Methylobacterium sp. WL6]|uniref:hypothetical protein n=1 Tax=Methylobacterium sp. WL6 TaxID=2603901 RepID=UPI0011CA50AE|nr:hypothetical protein [Methylobacterium sp. WL6]TXN70476.1 hypothetical protein FV230_10495 [Methylobacterium sp. WL6]
MAPYATREAFEGRDVFVAFSSAARSSSAATVAALFAAAFGLPPTRTLTEETPFQAQLDAWDSDHVLVYALAPDGDFPFMASIRFYRPIDVGQFASMARTHHVTIAYAADECRSYDDTYHIVDRSGTRTRQLSFDDTADSYACNIVGGGRTTEDLKS